MTVGFSLKIPMIIRMIPNIKVPPATIEKGTSTICDPSLR